MKIYGNTKTNLKLSEKAAAIYAKCDPLTITEHGDGSYSISGIEERDNMTAEEVNEWLEDLADDCGVCKTYRIKPEFLSAWGSETTEDTTVTDAEIERLSREWGVPVDDLMEQVEEAAPIDLKED